MSKELLEDTKFSFAAKILIEKKSVKHTTENSMLRFLKPIAKTASSTTQSAVISTAASTIANSSSPKDRKRQREEDDDIVEIVDTLTNGSATTTSSSSSESARTTTFSSYSESIHPSWKKVLDTETSKPYFMKLTKFVQSRRDAGAKVYPPSPLVLNALLLTPLDQVKVVILGQDPYHGPGQAHGLSFSVPEKISLPPSLSNIMKEVNSDIGGGKEASKRPHGCLESWAKQGVLLLNTCLTVEDGKANCHAGQGWETFTDAIIKAVSARPEGNVVFMLWGKPAQTKAKLINGSRHLILEAPHPSPLSVFRGFFGCKHFSAANAYLGKKGSKEIDWLATDK